MPLVTNEQTIKKEANYLKIADGMTITICSNVYSVKSHFVKKLNKTLLCAVKNCMLCSDGEKKMNEFYYIVKAVTTDNSESEGILRLPGGIVFKLNENERLLKKDKKLFQWIISKKGEGLATKYEVIRGDNVKLSDEDLKKNNEKLVTAISKYEEEITKRYDEMVANVLVEA